MDYLFTESCQKKKKNGYFFYKIKTKKIFVKISGKSPLFDPIVKSDLF